jgi:hypothetical protein
MSATPALRCALQNAWLEFFNSVFVSFQETTKEVSQIIRDQGATITNEYSVLDLILSQK